MQVSPVADMFSALPTHEYCTPTARNISHDEDPHDMLFVPFADDPTFDHARYLKAYQDFSWRTSALDPDCEVLLHYSFKLSPKELQWKL
jgi:histone-lysine N-methyltransferase EZH2